MNIKNRWEYNENLISAWFEEMKTVPAKYTIPTLDENTIALIKNICFTLNYGDDVFIMSVQILEEFLSRTDSTLFVIADPILNIFCVIFICGKYYNCKMKEPISCETLLCYLSIHTKFKYTVPRIKEAEVAILKLLNYKIPKNTKSDDLNTMYMFFVHPLKVKIRALELCTELLNLVVLFWPTIHRKLRSVYSGTELKDKVFTCLLAHRCYIPSGIILTGMRMIELFKVLDKDRIAMEFQEVTGIHFDHLQFLSDILHRIAEKKKNRPLFFPK